jgi:hypothetical protein
VYNTKLTKRGYREIEKLSAMEAIGKVDQIVFNSEGTLQSMRYITLSGSTVTYDEADYSVQLN